MTNFSFEIIDIISNETPILVYGTSTYIQVVVRKSEMDKPFNILLDSTCKKSKHKYFFRFYNWASPTVKV